MHRHEHDLRTTLCAALLVLTALTAPAPATAREGDPLTGGADPAGLLETLARAVQDRDTRAYADCLADSFSFTPYAGAVADHPDFDWDRWDRARELEFASRWLREHGGGQLDLSSVRDRAGGGLDRAEWTIDYRLKAIGAEFQAQAAFVMIRRDQRWYLREWVDLAPVSDGRDGLLHTSGEARAVVMR
jgi:hypothetical protein